MLARRGIWSVTNVGGGVAFPFPFPFPSSTSVSSVSFVSSTAAGSSSSLSMSPEEMEKRYLVPTYNTNGAPRCLPGLVITHGHGANLFTASGDRYLDFHSGIAVSALGQGNPEWVRAVTDQAQRLTHVSNLYHTAPALQLAQRLVELSPPGFEKVFFCNSGTEANEAALKFAIKFGGGEQLAAAPLCRRRSRVVAFRGNFHGRTLGSLSITHKPAIRSVFIPDDDSCATFAEFNNVESARAAVYGGTTTPSSCGGEDVCAIFVEPIQGEGGMNVASLEFMQGLRELCDEIGALLVVDEVQCGLGRSGRLWAHEDYHDVKPDMMTLAKPLAGGLPIGAVLTTDVVASRISPGDHGTTFGGGPIPCAAALAVLDQIADDRGAFLEASRASGRRLVMRALKLAERFPGVVVDVRSPISSGLFVGIEFSGPVRDVVAAAAERGVLVISAGERVLRLSPPLNTTVEEVDYAMDMLEESVRACN